MVSNTDNNNEIVGKPPISDLPEGQYRLIGWDIDTTGRRLIDEICQIAAYTPNSKFAQYIMPYGDLNPLAQRRYGIRVITVTRYRMLKDLKTNKFLKTKSEISALNDFVTWLEANKGDSTDGIILVFHEVRKMAPSMLLEALMRYNLYDRFAAVVKGFSNSYTLAENKCAKTMKSFSLKVLSRVLLDRDEDLSNAEDRAKICYNIVQHLGQGERQDLEVEGSGDTDATERHTAKLVHEYSRSINAEERDLSDLKKFLERQNTFRPVFKELMRFDWVSRQNASRLRRKLVENNLDYSQLKNAWDNGGRKSIEELLLKKVLTANEKESADLLEILDCYFDPEKKPVTAKFNRQRRTSSKSLSQKDIKPEKATNGLNSSSEVTGTSDLGSPQSDSTPRNEESSPKVEDESSRNETQVPVVVTVQ